MVCSKITNGYAENNNKGSVAKNTKGSAVNNTKGSAAIVLQYCMRSHSSLRRIVHAHYEITSIFCILSVTKQS